MIVSNDSPPSWMISLGPDGLDAHPDAEQGKGVFDVQTSHVGLQANRTQKLCFIQRAAPDVGPIHVDDAGIEDDRDESDTADGDESVRIVHVGCSFLRLSEGPLAYERVYSFNTQGEE